MTQRVEITPLPVPDRPTFSAMHLADAEPRSSSLRTTPLATGALIAAACAALFVILANGVLAGAIDDLDERVLHWLAAHRTRYLNEFFLNITALGSRSALAPLAVGVVVALALARRPGMAIAVAAAQLGGGALSRMLKDIVERDRPMVERIVPMPSGHAFPSGHVINSVTFFVTIALLVAGHVQGRKLRIFLVAYALFIGGLVSASRMYLGVHYPSDVIGGVLVGIWWSLLVVLAEKLWRHRAA